MGSNAQNRRLSQNQWDKKGREDVPLPCFSMERFISMMVAARYDLDEPPELKHVKALAKPQS
jgi:hypothetical protein